MAKDRFLVLDYSILCPTIQSRDCGEIVQAATSDSVKTRLTAYFRLKASRNRKQAVSLQAKVVERVEMIQNKRKFSTAHGGSSFCKGVKEVLKEGNRRAYMKSGFLAAKSTRTGTMRCSTPSWRVDWSLSYFRCLIGWPS